MQTITTIGIDIAKSVFQVHGVDAGDRVVIRRQLKRRSVLGILSEAATMPGWHRACASSHYSSRELQALGHTVRLMPPAYVKPTSNGRRTTWPMLIEPLSMVMWNAVKSPTILMLDRLPPKPGSGVSGDPHPGN